MGFSSTGVDSAVDNSGLRSLRRWLSKVSYGFDPFECWEWRGYRNGDGYGMIRPSDRAYSVGAHRIFYEALVGPTSPGLVIDHLCRLRRCVCPWHLEEVSKYENGRRARRDPDYRAMLVLCRERVDKVVVLVEASRDLESYPKGCGEKNPLLPAETGVTNISTAPTTTKNPKDLKKLEGTNPAATVEDLYREAYGI